MAVYGETYFSSIAEAQVSGYPSSLNVVDSRSFAMSLPYAKESFTTTAKAFRPCSAALLACSSARSNVSVVSAFRERNRRAFSMALVMLGATDVPALATDISLKTEISVKFVFVKLVRYIAFFCL